MVLSTDRLVANAWSLPTLTLTDVPTPKISTSKPAEMVCATPYDCSSDIAVPSLKADETVTSNEGLGAYVMNSQVPLTCETESPK